VISVLAPRTFLVAMYVVKRDAYDPIFTNSPYPMWATCPVWIRPGTTIYQVQSIDATMYNAIVQYQLESGKHIQKELVLKFRLLFATLNLCKFYC